LTGTSSFTAGRVMVSIGAAPLAVEATPLTNCTEELPSADVACRSGAASVLALVRVVTLLVVLGGNDRGWL
jgi:hypothetical protein